MPQTVHKRKLAKEQSQDRQTVHPKGKQMLTLFERNLWQENVHLNIPYWGVLFSSSFFSQGNMLSLKPVGAVGSHWEICTAWLQLYKPWNSKAEAKSPLSTSGIGAEETRNLQNSLHLPFLSASDFLTSGYKCRNTLLYTYIQLSNVWRVIERQSKRQWPGHRISFQGCTICFSRIYVRPFVTKTHATTDSVV